MKKSIFLFILLIVLCLSLSACSSGKDSPSSGNGTPSNGNTNPPEPGKPPGVPPTLTATPGDHQVTLSWVAPTNADASAITHYEYQQSLTSGTFDENTWTLAPGAESARQVTVSGLTAATAYFFRVRAVNGEGSGHPTQVSVTPYDGSTPEPGAPTNLAATSGDRQVTLSWEAPSAGGIITKRFCRK